MKKLGKLIYCALGAALVLTGCGKKDGKGGKFVRTSSHSITYSFSGNYVSADSYYTYEYNDAGLMSVKNTLKYDNKLENYFISEKVAYAYEGENKISEETSTYHLENDESFPFDEKAKKSVMDSRLLKTYSNYDEFGHYGEFREYHYTSSDKFTKATLYSIKNFVREYDSFGNITFSVELNENGSASIRRCTYDSLGRMTSQMTCSTSNYDEGYKFSSKAEYVYSEGNNSEFYNAYYYYRFANGVWEEGYHGIYSYDEEGVLTRYEEYNPGEEYPYCYHVFEKVSDTKLIFKEYEKDDSVIVKEGEEPTYYLDMEYDCEYIDHATLVEDVNSYFSIGEYVSYKHISYYESGLVSSMYVEIGTYDEFGNYLGYESMSYSGSDNSPNYLNKTSSTIQTYTYAKVK